MTKTIKTSKIPRSLYRYFWDVNVKKIDPSKKSIFVINRLLDKGDDNAVRYVRKNFSEEQIKEAFTSYRDFNYKVGNFWATFLGIPKEEVLCLQPHYLKMRRMHWSY